MKLAPGHSIEFGQGSSISLPGSKENSIDFKIVDETGNDVTDGITSSPILVRSQLIKFPIVLKSGDGFKIYDGEPLSNNTWEMLYGGLLEGHELIVNIDSNITDVGKTDNTMIPIVIDEFGNNVTDLYDFELNHGELQVSSSGYSSGDISKKVLKSPFKIFLKYLRLKDGYIYFRGTSYGDYNLQGWDKDKNHNLPISTNPLSFTSRGLLDFGYNPTNVQMNYLRAQVPYMVPYYTIDPFVGINDVQFIQGTSEILTFNHLLYSFDASNLAVNIDSQVLQDELIYRNYAYTHYLSIPESTKEGMLLIASNQGLDASDPNIILEVKTYIQNAASYNLKFAPIPEDVEDIALYFLNVSKEGICQHYATAATMMYRALGIPARYVTGYLGEANANEWTIITSEYAHAWVEVYIDGLGWVQGRSHRRRSRR